MSSTFRPGLDLARRFYGEIVRPILAEGFPMLPYAAALLGPGSEVLGYDTERSTDHDWGPRLLIFLDDDQDLGLDVVRDAIGRRLPDTFLGHPTTFPEGTHRVAVAGLGEWFRSRLGFDPRREIRTRDWLAVPSQEEPFPGRAAEVGDDLGSMIITARLARDVIRLCLMIERHYPPYAKWLGSAFARLAVAATIQPLLTDAIAARTWPERERHLLAAYRATVRAQNALGLTEPLDPTPVPFHSRPFLVPNAGRITHALLASITDPELRRLPPVGAVDQFMDSTDALNDHGLRDATAAAILGH